MRGTTNAARGPVATTRSGCHNRVVLPSNSNKCWTRSSGPDSQQHPTGTPQAVRGADRGHLHPLEQHRREEPPPLHYEPLVRGCRKTTPASRKTRASTWSAEMTSANRIALPSAAAAKPTPVRVP